MVGVGTTGDGTAGIIGVGTTGAGIPGVGTIGVGIAGASMTPSGALPFTADITVAGPITALIDLAIMVLTDRGGHVITDTITSTDPEHPTAQADAVAMPQAEELQVAHRMLQIQNIIPQEEAA